MVLFVLISFLPIDTEVYYNIITPMIIERRPELIDYESKFVGTDN